MKIATFILILLCLNPILNAGIAGIECKVCKCYSFKCDRLENPPSTCKNIYGATCDNSEDIHEVLEQEIDDAENPHVYIIYIS